MDALEQMKKRKFGKVKILKINGKTMSEVEFFEKSMNQWIQEKTKRIVFFVQRGIHTLFLELEPDWDNT